ncbi:hypothetical protein [Cupriavidus taiwanensis]|uniref:hypothetical protein n=1 Tax=Cupriavidus taiwanensis TaxID=164546 RepID=UPI0018DC7682|nr:hypothetical protein [Cupriavidus taiwanensis]
MMTSSGDGNEGEMTDASKPGPYSADATGLLLVDPCNDFLSVAGKLNGRAKPGADQVGTLANLNKVVTTVRAARVKVLYVPHHRANSGVVPRQPS